MSHSIFGQRFLSHREPAWHGLGMVTEELVGAREAFQRLGAYDVILDEVRTVQLGLDMRQRAIVRTPTTDDDQHRVFGIVSPDYTLIKPDDFCRIWDEHVAQPVETIGALGLGSTLFISTRLPNFGVRGDEVESYMVAVSPMTGGDAADVRVTPVRVVCRNTLIASGEAATEVYRIVHDSTALERMARWLSDIYLRALDRAEALAEAFDVMSRHRITTTELFTTVNYCYPLPRAARRDAPPEVIARREGGVEGSRRVIAQRRADAVELFNGRGTGIELPAAAGTAWGLYNSVAEVENYRRGRGNNSIARGILFGDRAKTMGRAFAACLEISRN